jgi:HAMP domain-containing protein
VRHKHGGSAAYLEILRGERSETPLVDIAKDEPIEIEHFQPPQDRIEELADEIRKLRELVEKSLSPSVAE